MEFKDRIEELCGRADRTGRVQSTMFLDGREQALAQGICNKTGMRCAFLGGWPEAERRMLFVLPDEYAEPDEADALCAVRIEGGKGLTHRDYLGSMLSVGIRRECVGDILVSDSSADAIVTSAAAGLLISELFRVGRQEVRTTMLSSLADLNVPERRKKLSSGTVASLRLDALGALAFSVSRSDMAALIEKGSVSVNWTPCLKPGKELAPGDILSVRGMGRAEVEEVGGQSRKGRTYVTMSVWL